MSKRNIDGPEIKMTGFFRRGNTVYGWASGGIGGSPSRNYRKFKYVEEARVFARACKKAAFVEYNDFHHGTADDVLAE